MALQTIKVLLAEAEQRLEKTSDSAKLDAQVLLSFVLSKDISYLYAWSDSVVDSEQTQRFLTLVERRLQGEPVAYLVGEKEFWSLTLKVSPATLIPRPDTETLVEQVLENHQTSNLSLLDLGTGTGAIALALASEQNNWQIDAVDYNHDAVKLAQENAASNQLSQVNIYQSDWFSSVDEDKRFDVIVTNPPYIDKNDSHLSQGDVRFEPASALVADNHGFADIMHIVKTAKKYLNANGYLYLEHGFEQGKQVRDIFLQNGYQACQTVKDLNGNDRITYAKFLSDT